MSEDKIKVASEGELPPPPPDELKVVVAKEGELPPPPTAELKKKEDTGFVAPLGSTWELTGSASPTQTKAAAKKAEPVRGGVGASAPAKKVPEPKTSYPETAQERLSKIEGMTFSVRYPELITPTKQAEQDFKKASEQAVTEVEKERAKADIERKKQRRLANLPKEIESLQSERNSLLLDRSPDAQKRLAANEAVIKKYQKEIEDNNKPEYQTLEKLNQKAIKGFGADIIEYLDTDPKLRARVYDQGLSERETYELIQQAAAKKMSAAEQDLATFQKEGTIDIAEQKAKIADKLHGKQTQLETSAQKLKSMQDEYLSKSGYSMLNKQFEDASIRLKSFEPYIKAAESKAKLYQTDLEQIDAELSRYEGKISGNIFNGTQAELDEYKKLLDERDNVILNLNNIYKTEELNGYEDAFNNYNDILSKKNSIASGLKNNPEYSDLLSNYESLKSDYDALVVDYKKYDEPAVRQRLDAYFNTVKKLSDYDQKIKEAKGELPTLEELEKAQKNFEQMGAFGDVLDVAGKAANSIISATQKFVASPFRMAASFSDSFGSGRGVYHFSDYMADLIEQTGKEPVFMRKEPNEFYNATTDQINWGVVPILGSVADQLGIILLLATTGKYASPTVARAMTPAYTDLYKIADITKNAYTATTIVPAYMISYGDNYKEAIEKGMNTEGAFVYANALSLLEGVSETVLPDYQLIFGKGAKNAMLRQFVKDYAKGKKEAVKKLVVNFSENAFQEAVEENIVMVGKSIATTVGHLIDNDIQVDIPTINQQITTDITSGLSGGGMGLIGQIKDNSRMYKMGMLEMAKNFDTAKSILTAYKDRGKLDEKRYDKIISDVQKLQSVYGRIPQGLSPYKTIEIADRMIQIKDLASSITDDKNDPINKINKKKIDALQKEIEGIIDDKDFDKKYEESLNNEVEEMSASVPDVTSSNIVLRQYTGSTDEKYGYINRGDGKGNIELTKSQFEEETLRLRDALRSKRDAEIAEIEKIRPDLTDDDLLLIDLPDFVDKTLDRVYEGLPTDPTQIGEAIDALDKKFDALEAYKNDPKRTHTIEQIDSLIDVLSEAKSSLQQYENEIRPGTEAQAEGKGKPEIPAAQVVAPEQEEIGVRLPELVEPQAGEAVPEVAKEVTEEATEMEDFYESLKNKKSPTELGEKPLLTPKQEQDAKEQQGRQMRDQGKQGEAEGLGNRNLPEGDRAQLQDGQKAEEVVSSEFVTNAGRKAEKPKTGVGSGEVNPTFSEKKVLVGDKTTIRFADGTKEEAEFMVVELDDIMASHNEESFNDTEGFPTMADGRNVNSRNYKGDKAAQGTVENYAMNLDPDILITDNVTTDQGAPIITEDGIVISANGRTMSMKLAAKRYPKKYAEYKQKLIEKAKRYGIDPKAVATMKNPVLVKINRNVKEYSVDSFDRYNPQFQKAEAPIDRLLKQSYIIRNNPAVRDKLMKLLSQYDSMADLYASAQGRKELLNFLTTNKFILPQEMAEYADEKANFTDTGKKLAEDIIVGAILRPETIKASQDVKAFRNNVINAIAALAQNYTLGEFSLEDVINEAVLLQQKVAAWGAQKDFWKYLLEQKMFEAINPDFVIMNRLIDSGSKNFRQFIEKYNDGAKGQGGEAGAVLLAFDDVVAKSKQEVLDYITKQNLSKDELQILALVYDRYAEFAEQNERGIKELGERLKGEKPGEAEPEAKQVKPNQDEQEAEAKQEDGEPMPKGVSGVRPEGKAGEEGAELRPEEKVSPSGPVKLGFSAIDDMLSLPKDEYQKARNELKTKYGAEKVADMIAITRKFEQIITGLEQANKIRKECP